MSKVQPIPAGYSTVTPGLTVKNAKEAMEFYKKAFGAEQHHDICWDEKNEKVMHAEMKIGNSIIMINDEFPEWGCAGPSTLGSTPVSFYIYVENCDELFERATKAGATAIFPVSDSFWGDRHGCVQDPFGHKWSIATHVADYTPEQIEKNKTEWMKKQKDLACAK
jgi:PhnB protein